MFKLKNVPIFLLLLFAALQFFLLLRHKSPYLSDSYFYKHIYYSLHGDNFNIAREKVLSQINLKNVDEISLNFYTKEDSYRNSLSFFTKRPLYPLMAYIFSLVTNDYLAFLLPVFLGYIGAIIISYKFFSEGLSYVYATVATAILVGFYPLLDWSTYFLTDSIGFFFWMAQILLIYHFLKSGKTIYFYAYLFVMGLSLTLREQSLLVILLLFLLFIASRIFLHLKKYSSFILRLLVPSFLIGIVYILLMLGLGQKNLLDTIIYTMNDYGLRQNSYSHSAIFLYIVKAVFRAHTGFFKDLISHHWWIFFSALGFLSVVQTLMQRKKLHLNSVLLLSSAFASYAAIFLYPVLSYRYFFPVLIGIIFFAIKFFENFVNYVNKKGEDRIFTK